MYSTPNLEVNIGQLTYLRSMGSEMIHRRSLAPHGINFSFYKTTLPMFRI